MVRTWQTESLGFGAFLRFNMFPKKLGQITHASQAMSDRRPTAQSYYWMMLEASLGKGRNLLDYLFLVARGPLKSIV